MKYLLLLTLLTGLMSSPVYSQWVQCEGQIYTDPNEMAVGSNGHLFVAGPDVYRSTNKGKNWTTLSVAGGSDYNAVSIADNGFIYLAEAGGLARSTNNGASWAWFTETDFHNLPVFAVLAHKPNNLLVGTTNATYMSTNGGKDWGALSLGQPSRIVTNFAIDSAGNTYFTASGGLGVYRTTDRIEWNRVDELRGLTINDIEVASNGHLYVALSGGVALMKSSDNGLSWHEVNNHLNFTSVNRLLMTLDGRVFVSDGAKLYLTHDAGQTWEVEWTPPSDGVNSLAIAPDYTLYAGPNRYGPIFRKQLTADVKTLLPSDEYFRLISEVVEDGKLRSIVAKSGLANITLHDLHGRIVMERDELSLREGEETVDISHHLPSSAYLLTVGLNGRTYRKMILVR